MRPPLLSRRLLERLLPAAHRAVVLSHLDEEFERVQRERLPRAASRWYHRQVLAAIPGALQMRARSSGLAYMPGDFAQDTRYALRLMRRAPGFSASAVLMLAIGLGLVAGAYTVINGIFVRGWAVPDNASVFRAYGTAAGAPEGGRIHDGFSLGAFKYFRENARSADYVAYLIQYFSIVKEPGAPRIHSAGLFVTDKFPDVVRIPLQIGGGFRGSAADGARAIVSDRVWKRTFNADPSILGRNISLSGVPTTIVGVTAPGYDSLAERTVDIMVDISAAKLWRHMVAAEVTSSESACCIILAGRRRTAWTMPQVKEELAVLTAQYRRSIAQPDLSVAVRDTAPGVRPGRGAALVFSLLGIAVTLVWALTCGAIAKLRSGCHLAPRGDGWYGNCSRRASCSQRSPARRRSPARPASRS
jgi:hypothetical protein